MKLLKSNTHGTSIVGLALLFAAIWFITGCTPTESTEVLGERLERPTTTTVYVPPTTTTAYIPPTTTTVYTPNPADVAYAHLISEIPALARNSRADVEDLLGLTCDLIDEWDGDFYQVGTILVTASAGTFDLDYGNAGTIVAAAVVIRCPEWAAAASDFANS